MKKSVLVYALVAFGCSSPTCLSNNSHTSCGHFIAEYECQKLVSVGSHEIWMCEDDPTDADQLMLDAIINSNVVPLEIKLPR